MGGGRVCLGVIVGPHGLRGQVRIKSFTDSPEDVCAYGPVSDRSGERHFALSAVGRAKGVVLARIEGVADRNQAEALKGTELFVARAVLPVLEDDEAFYHADLIGLAAEDREGRPLGTVRAVHDFGAGVVIELEGSGGESMMVPFTKAAVPLVDSEAGRLVVDPPAEIVAGPARDPDGAEDT